MPSDHKSNHRKDRQGVFISYARSDGKDFANHLRQQLDAEGFKLWQDLIGMEGGRNWWLQITEALDNVEFMALVVTPNALKSEIVRKEWRYARQQGVCVYPIKGAPDLDFKSMPRWMREQHFYDLSEKLGWEKFIADLKRSCDTPRVPFMVEDLPVDFVERPGEFDQLIMLLLDQKREEPIAITAALRGTGGYGKTTLAKALCHDERVREAFDDGILWVTLGENPGNLITRVEELIHVLSGERPGYTNLTAAVTRLKELLAERDLLIVIDDVWNKVDLEPFLQGGPRCARLITTRNLDILPGNAKQVKVDAMQPGEAILLLGAKLVQRSDQTPQQRDDDEIDRELRALSERLGHWPLLLALANSTLRDRVAAGETLSEALAFHNADLTENGLTEFAVTDDAARESVVKKVLSVSFKRLTEAEVARFYELAIFPEKANVPLATVEKLWKQTGNLTRTNADKLSTRLFNLSLLLNLDRQSKTLRLHDVIRKFLNDEQKGQLAPTHNQLLDAHRPATRWADLPENEPYCWDHLAYHLIEAGRGEELVATVKDWRYLAAKNLLRKSLAVEADLLAAEKIAADDDPLRALRRNFANSGHLLNRCENRNDIKVTLFSRLQHLDELKSLTRDLEQHLKRPYIAPTSKLPDLPHPALVRTLTGHSDKVTGCAISADGTTIVSASSFALPPQYLPNENAMRADGTIIVSASEDNTLKVWDARTGECLATLHTDGLLSGCACSEDGLTIVAVGARGVYFLRLVR